MAFARKYLNLDITIVDIENVCVVGREIVEENNLSNRITFHASDFLTDELPQDVRDCLTRVQHALFDLGGFVSTIIGQEDVEFVVRFILAGKAAVPSADLAYLHPPLLVPSFRKPKAVGHSFYRLKNRYPFLLWLLLLINCSRHAPLYLVPVRKYREMGRFGPLCTCHAIGAGK